MTQTLRKFQQNNSMNPRGSMISQQGLSIHRDSRVISKIQPKIRIIHIFAPEIIHTDVAHFPETVQRLTGKSSSATAPSSSSRSAPKKSTININSNPRASRLSIESHGHEHDNDNDHDDHGSYDHDHGHHHHGYDHGGFLDDLQGVNLGFMQEMGEFPFVSMEAHHHNNHHLNAYGDTHHSLSYRG